MIDVGEGASPVWWDADGDGDLDLLIGNQGIRGNQGVRASIYFYENVGSATQPALLFRTEDFKQFSAQVQATQVQLQVATLPGKIKHLYWFIFKILLALPYGPFMQMSLRFRK